MAQMKFTARVTQEQWEEFFRRFHMHFEECKIAKKSPSYIVIDLKWHGDVEDWVILDDKTCNIATRSCITSNDWITYLRELFGEEYDKEYSFSDYSNDFVGKLTKEEIYSLLLEKMRIDRIPTYQSEEAPQLLEYPPIEKGTRRFKLEFYPNIISKIVYYEFVLYPYPDLTEVCQIHDYPSLSWEKLYFKFMVKKFGKPYVDYCIMQKERTCAEKWNSYLQKETEVFQKRKTFLQNLVP